MKGKMALGAALALTLVLTGCSSNDKAKLEEEVTKLEKEVTTTVNDAKEYTKEDIAKATSYIEENIEKVKDGEIAKNLVKAGAYLEEAAKKGAGEVSHELAKLGKETREYAGNIYVAAEEEKDKLMKEGSDTFKNWGEKLSNEKDKLVNEFHKLINR